MTEQRKGDDPIDEDQAPDSKMLVPYHDRTDSHLLFVSISDIWVLVVRKFNDGRTFCRLQKLKSVAGGDDELVDITPIT